MIQVIERAIDILEFVATHGKEPVQLMHIAAHLKISQPTCANIVKTLVARNYLENVSRKAGYILGPGTYTLTGNLSYNHDLIMAAGPFMEALTHSLNETCLIAVLKNNKRLMLHSVQSDQDLQVRAKTEADVYATSTGRLLISFLTPKELDNLVAAVGLPAENIWPGVQTRAALEKAIRKIQKDQLVQTVSEKHICGFAVPIQRDGQVVAGLSVFLPESRLRDKVKEKIISRLRLAAKKINDSISK
ncbi:MAG TPA: IclR family transcriptional regulator C-terminal domain-containing protein [Chitinophagaceae bacterium]|nr:IclR family transcriptional regulator C-terminal domain-containing protein [Chitinophagaceae bacterium]